jgi:hypothetical protein
MTSLYGKPSANPVEAAWHHNPLAFFGVAFLAVFLGGYLACLAAGYTIYRIASPPLERKLNDWEREFQEWDASRAGQRRGP